MANGELSRRRRWLGAAILVALMAPLAGASAAESGKGSASRTGGIAIQSSDSGMAPQITYARRAVGNGAPKYTMPQSLKSQVSKCHRSGRAFGAIDDRRWVDGDAAAPVIRRSIETLVTRDFEKSEVMGETMSAIFLEGATSSQHWHDVTVLGDVLIKGQQLRIVAIWSLAYGKGAYRTERAFSLVEYLKDGSRWRPATLGVGLEIYLGSQTELSKLVWIDRETYAVELRVKEEGLPDRSDFFVPAWGCFWSVAAGDRSQLSEGLTALLKGAVNSERAR